jgi:hypothetical protein
LYFAHKININKALVGDVSSAIISIIKASSNISVLVHVELGVLDEDIGAGALLPSPADFHPVRFLCNFEFFTLRFTFIEKGLLRQELRLLWAISHLSYFRHSLPISMAFTKATLSVWI